MLYLGDDWSSTRLDDVRALLRGVRAKRLLDVGCGGGELTVHLSEFADDVLGVDPWRKRINGAKRRPSPRNVRFACISPDQLETGRFDVVTCLEVLEHMPREEAPAFLANLRRLLAPGGTLVLTTPNRTSFQRVTGIRALRGGQRFPTYPYEATPGEDDWHHYEYTVDELRTLLGEAGFAVRKHQGDHISVHRIRGLGRMSLIFGSRVLGRAVPHLAKHHLVCARAA